MTLIANLYAEMIGRVLVGASHGFEGYTVMIRNDHELNGVDEDLEDELVEAVGRALLAIERDKARRARPVLAPCPDYEDRS